MKRNLHSNVARTAAVALTMTMTVAWVSAIGAAPKCYFSRYQVNSSTGDVYDAATGLTWQQTVDPMSYAWDGAKIHCSGLGGDWRLPSLTELQTIVDDARSSPPLIDSAFPGTPREPFWTSSPLANKAGYAWYVNFSTGFTLYDVVSNTYRVRCVR